MNATTGETRIDPITLEVFWNRLIATVNEQAAALMRTSFTTIVRESGDLSAGVFDTRGYMIAQAVTGTPGHINAMATCIHHFLAVYPPETLSPGDVMITNDPQKTSGHLHDFTVITPIFSGDRLVAFFGNTCHVLDIGGRVYGTDAHSMFEEGLYVPITKLFIAGQPNTELLKLLAANVRTPEPVLGDIYAQVAANDVGGRHLLEFMEEFGLDDITALSDEIVDRSERAMRAAIRQVPDGEYENEVYSDGYEAPVLLHVKITKSGDSMHVDWTGSSMESIRGINVVLNYTHAYTTYALKCALAPDVPNNEGSFRPVTVSAPSAFHPERAAARAGRRSSRYRTFSAWRDLRCPGAGAAQSDDGRGRREYLVDAVHRLERRRGALDLHLVFVWGHRRATDQGRDQRNRISERGGRRADRGH